MAIYKSDRKLATSVTINYGHIQLLGLCFYVSSY